MWLDQTTGCRTRTSPSATSALKPSLPWCPSTTAGPAVRACAVPAPNTWSLYPPEDGITQWGSVTAATPAQTVCRLSNWVHFQTFSKRTQSSSDDPQNHCESWYCCLKRTVIMGLNHIKNTRMLKMITTWFPAGVLSMQTQDLLSVSSAVFDDSTSVLRLNGQMSNQLHYSLIRPVQLLWVHQDKCLSPLHYRDNLRSWTLHTCTCLHRTDLLAEVTEHLYRCGWE